MPIYEYRCSSCGHELEALQKFSDAPLTACPSCGAAALVKQPSAGGFQLKGSGWYVTDFKGGGAKPSKTDSGKADESAKGKDAPATGDSKSEGATGAKTDTKSDTKSDTKTDTSSAAPAPKTGTTPAAT